MTGILHIVVARKPIEGTIAENCLQWGCGALWIDGTRIGNPVNTKRPCGKALIGTFEGQEGKVSGRDDVGRWPANLIVGGEEVVRKFPETAPAKSANRGLQHSGRHGGLSDLGENFKSGTDTIRGHSDSGGSAARFFFNVTEQESDERS